MITEAWIEKLSRVLHNSTDGLCDEDVRNLHDLRQSILPIPGVVEKEVAGPVAQELRAGLAGFLREQEVAGDKEALAARNAANGVKPDEKPFPGYLDKEVPGEVKKEALAARDAAMQAQGIPPSREEMLEARKNASRANTAQLVADRKLSAAEELARAQHEKRNANFRAFIQHMAALDPFSTERMADMLAHARTPVRYQAWGRLDRNIALWSSASCGGDLANLNVEYCSAPDRIEMIDRIGFHPDIISGALKARITEINAIELQVHALESKNTSHLAYELLCRSRGLRLFGAGRPIVLPRASVPLLHLNCDVPGWIFVEGWRLSLG